MSRNLVELIRRHHAVHAPTALDGAQGRRRRSRRDHRRRSPRRGRASRGCPRPRSTASRRFYDDLLAPARRASRARLHRHRVLRGDRRRARRRAARRASGSSSASAATTARVSLAETVCLGFCHSSPAVRDGDTIDAGPGVLDRVARRRRARRAPSPSGVSMLAEPVLTEPGDWSGLRPRARPSWAPRSCSRRSRRRRSAAAAAPASRPGPSGGSRAARQGDEKFIVANGDEGDPGSYIDKYLMEQQPGAAARGAWRWPATPSAPRTASCSRARSTRCSKPALDAAAAAGARGRLARRRHPGRRASAFDVTIVEGAGSYVVGEETALLACLQGLRGTVSARPPFPAERGVLRPADRRQQHRDAVQHPVHRAPRRRGLRGAQPRRRRQRLEARLLQRALRAPGRLRGAASGRRCASCARTSPAACATGARSRRCRSAARSAGSCPRR